jgi:AcrR family transcriptional regulator
MPRPSAPILDAEGLSGLSMRKLADSLGVKAASLYRYVTTKDDLLDEISDEIMLQVDTSAFASGWRDGLTEWARSYRAALAAHPNMVPFLAGGPARRTESLARADAVHGGLTGAGWPARYATMIGASTKHLVVGSAIASFAEGFSDDVQVYLDRYPNLYQAHLLAEHAKEVDEDSFELGLQAFLDGLSLLYPRVAGQRS